jgi:hypothetical protein
MTALSSSQNKINLYLNQTNLCIALQYSIQPIRYVCSKCALLTVMLLNVFVVVWEKYQPRGPGRS